ncbi:MAG: metallophosphoesterase [Actinomycetota bacterium]|nr:metallophosphoesterase [Actinomycetota bacterium]
MTELLTEKIGGQPALTILHLSDTHLFGADASGATRLHYGVVDTTAALRRVLDSAAGISSLDLVIASGDLSDDGSQHSYRTLAELLGPWAAERGATVVYTMGNHDLRDGFEAVLGAREQVSTVRGFRIVTLDTSVPGAGYGELDDSQLDRLQEELATPAEHGTVLVLHHPPVPAITALLTALELQRPQALQAICAAGDVRVVLCGHYHHAMATAFDGVAVLVAPAVANCTDIRPVAGHETARAGSGFALIEVPAEVPAGGIRFLPVNVPSADDGAVVSDLTPDQVAQIALAAGPPTPAGQR